MFEYIDGGSIEDKLNAGFRFSEEEAIRIATDIADAMKSLHHNLKPPIIHRDISSQNILLRLDENGRIKNGILADFGISRGLENKEQLQQLSPIGHPRYRSLDHSVPL